MERNRITEGNRIIEGNRPLPVVVSVAPKSQYVKLYKDAIKDAIKILVNGNKEAILSIEDCEIIRSKLPSAHTKVNGTGTGTGIGVFYYDHLFVKYFLNNKKYNYDPAYVDYGTDMFLYLHLYKCIKRKQIQPTSPKFATSSSSSSFEKYYLTTEDLTTEDLLQDNIRRLSFMIGELSISKIMKKLCEDIKDVLYLNINPLTIEKYDRVCKNMKVLQYVYHIYHISEFFAKINEDIKTIIFLNTDDKEIKYIYETIKDKDVPVLINIYEKINLLYKYCIPYDFIYINSSNCKNDSDSFTLADFNDENTSDTGDVSIIPYFKETKLNENLNTYNCFFTEGLYKWIATWMATQWRGSFEIDSIKIRNPKTNELLTLHDIIYVFENKIKLIERAFKEETPSTIRKLEKERLLIKQYINLLLHNNIIHQTVDEKQALDEKKSVFKGLFELSRKRASFKRISGYLYLTINLGSKSSPICFNVITSNIASDISNEESSLAITYPNFESKEFYDAINSLVSQIEKNVYTPKDGSFNYLINIQKKEDKRDEKLIYDDYRLIFNKYIYPDSQFKVHV
jgi:hypothetical protein